MSERSTRILSQGMLAGIIGYATVAIIFAASNMISGQSPFHTAAVLGATLFYGATDPTAVTVMPAYVFAFNGLHLMAFLVFGIIGAWLALLADRGEQLWYLSLIFWLLVAFHVVGGAQMLAMPLEGVISAGAIWAAGILASAAMAAYLLVVHPRMRRSQGW